MKFTIIAITSHHSENFDFLKFYVDVWCLSGTFMQCGKVIVVTLLSVTFFWCMGEWVLVTLPVWWSLHILHQRSWKGAWIHQPLELFSTLLTKRAFRALLVLFHIFTHVFLLTSMPLECYVSLDCQGVFFFLRKQSKDKLWLDSESYGEMISVCN